MKWAYTDVVPRAIYIRARERLHAGVVAQVTVARKQRRHLHAGRGLVSAVTCFSMTGLASAMPCFSCACISRWRVLRYKERRHLGLVYEEQMSQTALLCFA